jgi:hypothetical protein
MDTNDMRFLPMEFEDKELTIKEPYLSGVMKYLNSNKIEFEYIEAKVIIPALKIKEIDLDNIITMIKDCRDKKLQRGILRNYL